MAISFGFNGGLWLSCSRADRIAVPRRGGRAQTTMLVERAGGEPTARPRATRQRRGRARRRERRIDPLGDGDRLVGDRAQQAARLARVEADEIDAVEIAGSASAVGRPLASTRKRRRGKSDSIPAR